MRPTHERVMELFNYDPETGILIRRKSGKLVGNNSSGRALVNIDKEILLVHRVIWFYMTGQWPIQVDHINGRHWDNRWENLREATNTQNSRNSRKGVNNSSGYKGVSYIERLQKYRAYITVDRKQIGLGCYSTAEEAAAVYDKAAEEYFGEFANLNFPKTN
jgi:HNH endonuclease/AP2 domain